MKLPLPPKWQLKALQHRYPEMSQYAKIENCTCESHLPAVYEHVPIDPSKPNSRLRSLPSYICPDCKLRRPRDESDTSDIFNNDENSMMQGDLWFDDLGEQHVCQQKSFYE